MCRMSVMLSPRDSMVHANAVVSTLWEKHSLSYLVLLLGVGPKDCLGPCDLTIDQGLSAHPARETALMRSRARLYNPAPLTTRITDG